jgi:SH3 domain protein
MHCGWFLFCAGSADETQVFHRDGVSMEEFMLLCQRIGLIMFLLLFVSTSAAWSATRYIADQLIVSLRELPDDNSNIISYLKTDTPVELLEAGKEYSKVTTADGATGYIQSHYLTEKIPKATTIKRLTQENQSLNERIQNLDQKYQETFSKGDDANKKLLDELESLRASEIQLKKDLSQSNDNLAEITDAYESLKANSQDIIAITDERNRLKTRVEELSTDFTRLQEEKKGSQKNQAIRWFLAGAGVLLFGWMLGKFSRSRRRSSLY